MIYYSVNVSQYEGTPPADDQHQRRHSFGPVYPLVDVERLALAGALTFWAKGSARDAQKWKIDIADSAQLIGQALSTGQYLHSEWCLHFVCGGRRRAGCVRQGASSAGPDEEGTAGPALEGGGERR